ncbi:MAG: hypothetical protein EA405_05850 [Rhodospirillales bacterium]|nr:MAG: hypothetical protein EA405_05850 [Rhodospirillales bacterium]
MSHPVELKVVVMPDGDCTADGVALVARRIREGASDHPDVARVQAATAPAPTGAKAGEAMLLGALIVALAPVAVEGLLNLIRDILSRPGAPPVKVAVELAGRGTVAIEIPSGASPAEVQALAHRLLDTLKAG